MVVRTGVVSVLEVVLTGSSVSTGGGGTNWSGVSTGGGGVSAGGGATATIYSCELFSVIYVCYILTRLTFTIRCQFVTLGAHMAVLPFVYSFSLGCKCRPATALRSFLASRLTTHVRNKTYHQNFAL